MPGITGIITKQSNGNEFNNLNIMLSSMMHESFYVSGTYKNLELRSHLGYVSIEGSFSDCMPIYNEKKDLVMFLSGECFLDKDTINSLKSRGHEFNPSNASYLIHLYEEQKDDFFKNLNGWFSGIILDTQRTKAVLFNDRYGMQKIYYHENENGFYFSSEAKSLLKILPYLRKIDFQSMGEFITLDCAIANKTFFSNISLLPAGSAWSFTNGNVEKNRYFDQSSLENQPILEKKQFYKELGETFEKILPRYFSGESIGMSLTGGLDTKMILACFNSISGDLPCFTYGGMYGDSIDVRIARRVAEVCGQTHEVIRLDNKYLSDYASQVKRGVFITDGLADACTSDEVYLSKLARQIAPIKMTGKFGSQVMRNVSVLRYSEPEEQLINRDFQKYISIAKEKYTEIRSGHSLSFFLYKEIPWYFSRFSNAEYSQLTVRSPYLDNDFVNLLYKAPAGGFPSSEFQLYLIKKNSPELYRIMTNRGFGGSSAPLVSKPLKLTYKFLMKLDTLLVEGRLPYNLQHWVARLDYFQASRLLIGYDKFRFYRLWFQNQLSQYLKEMLLDSKTLNRPYWNKDFIIKIVNDHINGRGNYFYQINKVLTMELIHRTLVEDI